MCYAIRSETVLTTWCVIIKLGVPTMSVRTRASSLPYSLASSLSVASLHSFYGLALLSCIMNLTFFMLLGSLLRVVLFTEKS